MTLSCPGSEPFHLRGGHRLWAAPEDPRVTYRPDDDPVEVDELPDGVCAAHGARPGRRHEPRDRRSG